MGSRYQNIMVTLGVFFAAVSAYIAWRGPRAADPAVVQSVATHPIGGLIVVCVLFVLAGLLNIAPLLIRLLPQKKQSGERQLFVCSNGYPLMRIQSGIALSLHIFSSVATKLVYAHATLTRREGFQGQTHQIELESPEQHIIPAMQMFIRMLEVKLDPEEAKRFMAPNVEIMGQLKLEENNTHQVFPFQLLTHRECPEDPQVPQLRAKLQEAQTKAAQPDQGTSLRDTAIGLYDRLATFEHTYEKKSHIQQERGESGEDFVIRQLEKALQQNTQMAADYRLQFESDMRSLNDQIQVRSGACHPLTADIEQAVRTCNAKTIKGMREHLWECARTMDK